MQAKLRVSIRCETRLTGHSFRLKTDRYWLIDQPKRDTLTSTEIESNGLVSTPATILVVDDEWMNRELMQAVLENAGYHVLLATGSADALELARTRKPNLVIMDVRLRYPTEGYDLCRKLRTDPVTSSARLAMLTAMESPADRALAMEAGADAYLNRVMDISELLSRIDDLLKTPGVAK